MPKARQLRTFLSSEKRCLRCNKKFIGLSKFNRLCQVCHKYISDNKDSDISRRYKFHKIDE